MERKMYIKVKSINSSPTLVNTNNSIDKSFVVGLQITVIKNDTLSGGYPYESQEMILLDEGCLEKLSDINIKQELLNLRKANREELEKKITEQRNILLNLESMRNQ